MSDVVKPDIATRVQELMKLPQSLCRMCGMCCKIVNFKGGLSYEEVKKLSEDPNAPPTQSEGARDFLTIFKPYDSVEDAKKVDEGFVNFLFEIFGKDSNLTFFHCRFLAEDNTCLIHEDRPLLCRMHPTPNEKTLFHPNCGFKEQAQKNWEEISSIIEDLKKRKEELQNKISEIKNNNK
jgi:Fe-S-cluster containining protein